VPNVGRFTIERSDPQGSGKLGDADGAVSGSAEGGGGVCDVPFPEMPQPR